MEDKELLALIREDASKGIETAIRLYGGAVRKICMVILSGYEEEDIEEAVSDCFLELWKSREHYDVQRNVSIKCYLYGIARNIAKNRKRTLAKKKPCDVLADLEDTTKEDLEEQIMKEIDAQILRDLINCMESPNKEIFVYRYFYQNTVKEIAEKLELPAKKVENQLSRGKSKLRKQLVERGCLIHG
ncbi:RNA polymerase sigma factor [Anaerosporobacter faecicola]|uniref:RNA polymerase sigma factor n=1 Tax=Anaerosporobacter faecicola TaxID=2718714 RepID=UPI00143AD975|nr:sigma-70 family RNA polymerase sigma factor [Anaerosporobacter faecicola]